MVAAPDETVNILEFSYRLEAAASNSRDARAIAARKIREAFYILQDVKNGGRLSGFAAPGLNEALARRCLDFLIVECPADDLPMVTVEVSAVTGADVDAGPIRAGRLVAEAGRQRRPVARDRAIEIARRSAAQHTGEQPYLPKTPLEALDFQPHTWVLAAIRAASEEP
jgi:hypothetical protein